MGDDWHHNHTQLSSGIFLACGGSENFLNDTHSVLGNVRSKQTNSMKRKESTDTIYYTRSRCIDVGLSRRRRSVVQKRQWGAEQEIAPVRRQEGIAAARTQTNRRACSQRWRRRHFARSTPNIDPMWRNTLGDEVFGTLPRRNCRRSRPNLCGSFHSPLQAASWLSPFQILRYTFKLKRISFNQRFWWKCWII